MVYEMKFHVHISVPRLKFAERLKTRLLKSRLARHANVVNVQDSEAVVLVVEALYSKRSKIIDMINIIGETCSHLRELRVIKVEDVSVPVIQKKK